MAKIYIDNLKLKAARSRIFNSLLVNKTEKLFDILEITSGDYLPVSKMFPGNVKVYGGGGLTNQTHSQSNINEQTIGIGRVGARCGCVFSIDPNSWITDNALFVSKIKKPYDLGFLVHFLNHLDLNRFANTAAQPVISLKRIANVSLPSIDLNEQVRISNILNEIENGNDYFENDHFGINESLRTINDILSLQSELQTQQTLLTQLRQAVLQEAVQGKLTAKFREAQTARPETGADLLARIRAEKADLIRQGKLRKEKPLPPITDAEKPFDLPEGWVWCRLGEICFVTKLAGFEYTNYFKPNRVGDIPIVRAQNVKPFKLLEENLLYIDYATSLLLERSALNRKSLLITFIGAGIGEVAIFDKKERWHLAPNVAKAEPYSESIVEEYLQLLLLSEHGQREFFKIQKATAQPSLSMGTIREVLIPLPPLIEQQAIVSQVEQLLENVKALETENRQQQAEVDRLMQAVLREAFAGKEEVVTSDIG